MKAQKLSISLPQEQCKFIDAYQADHHYKTRSEVIRKALYLLEQSQLEYYYQEANQELNDDFEITTLDGIEENKYSDQLLCEIPQNLAQELKKLNPFPEDFFAEGRKDLPPEDEGFS